MISNTSARQQVSATQPAELKLCWKKRGLGVAVLFGILMVFSTATATRLIQNFGLAVKNKLGVLRWEPSVSHCRPSRVCFRFESTGTEGEKRVHRPKG